MRRQVGLAAKLTLSLCLALPAPVAFANTPVVADVSAKWVHAWTGAELLPSLGGLDRTGIEDYGKDLVDIAASYREASGDSWATIYLFRAGLVDASIWHDRILATVAQQTAYGKLDMEHGQSQFFTPRSGGELSGLRTVIPSSEGSTGVAIFPKDDWLVVIRFTSHTLDAAALDARLATLTDSLSLAASRRPVAPAYAMAPCTDAISGEQANLAKPEMAEALMIAMMVELADEPDDKQETKELPKLRPDRQFSRDTSSTAGYGVYRPGGSVEHFIIAISDAGVTASVDRSEALEELGHGKRYALTLGTTTETLVFAPFTAMPTPEAVFAAINGAVPRASVRRPLKPGDGPTINIVSP